MFKLLILLIKCQRVQLTLSSMKHYVTSTRFYSSLELVSEKISKGAIRLWVSLNHINIWNMLSIKEQTKTNFIMTSLMQVEFSLH